MKMKLLGALGVAAVGLMGLGLTNTGAWFSDQESNSVVATAGALDVKFRLDLAENNTINVGPLLPGEELGPFKMGIANPNSPNSTELKYRVTSENESGDLIPGLRARVVHGNCGDSDTVLDNGNQFDIEPSKAVTNLDFTSAESITGGTLAVNNTHCFELYVGLPPSAGNEFQGATGSFDIVVRATQPDAPWPSLS